MGRTINTNLYPSKGYYFKDSDKSVHRADSWAGVIERVKKYRVRAGLAAGNPEAEVIEQACRDNPGLCHSEDSTASVQLRKTSLKTRVMKWMAGLWESREAWPIQFVEGEERARRSGVCAKCKFNQSLPGGCASCSAAVSNLRKRLIGQRFVDGRLHACLVLGEDLPISVHMEHTAVENGELPPACWRKRQI